MIVPASCTPEGLTLDESRHEYQLSGRSQIGVTAALRAVGLIDIYTADEAARERGTGVAATIQAWHRSGLDPVDLPPTWAPYFAAYRSFLAGVSFKVDAVEEMVCDPTLCCAGRLDLRGQFRGATGSTVADRVDVIDVKTGAVPSWVGYQTAGYVRLLPADLRARCRRWVLQLCDDASFRLLPLTKRSDEQVFVAAVTVALARRGWL